MNLKRFIGIALIMFTLLGCEKEMKGWVNTYLQDRQKNLQTSPIPGYKFAWADEFSDALDESEWAYRETETAWLGPVPSIGLKRNVETKDGKLIINMKVENYTDPTTNKSYEATAGGVATMRKFKFGYYEISAKLSSVKGWHEAFWTFWQKDAKPTDYPAGWENTVRTEIDIFEHTGEYDNKTFTYGMYEHRGGWNNSSITSVHRDMYFGETDLTSQFNKYAFEYTPEYINYFFNDELIKTVDLREVEQMDFFIRLSVVASRMPDGNGTMEVDYLRCFEADMESDDYKNRNAMFLQILEDMKGETESDGVDLWVEAEDFTSLGGWTVANDDNIVALKGHPNTAPTDDQMRYATTEIRVEQAGAYKLWVRSKDFKNNLPGRRYFNVFVNDGYSLQKFGTHAGDNLYEWEDGGTVNLTAGVNKIEIYDASLYYASLDKLLLTTDQSFVPTGFGGESNVEHVLPPVQEAAYLWMEAEDFLVPGAWNKFADNLASEGFVMRGDGVNRNCGYDENDSKRFAKTKVNIPATGRYKLWVRAKDFHANNPAWRHFEFLIGDNKSPHQFGTHKTEGVLFAWEDGGTFDLQAGEVVLSLYNSSCYYATCDRVLITNDLGYTPSGVGEDKNVTHQQP